MGSFIDFLNESDSMIRNVKRVKDIFKKMNIDFMFIGKGAAIFQGFPDTTQDIDVYPRNELENNKKIVRALRKLKFKIDDDLEQQILQGKDFIQFVEPFEFDLVFAPDGFENYKEALKYKKMEKGVPVMSIKGIIRSKKSAGRKKDLLSIDDLENFDAYLNEKKII
jgi:hypothetical protein